ncbi:MDR family MFS transporter [Streptomyces sp. NBC_00986]|uniref:MDR family MFS transporter n=1 Tax=Streptomyces sp. NBC_00986 TaxID=2903702 RepID=UPI00386D7CFF|nr:multidrug efflux MFS transporter [Streptomyces sp. NBC_00986]WSX64512.1 multidrug efflux MFS transporter [Streptomyces sp. NBC_00986]
MTTSANTTSAAPEHSDRVDAALLKLGIVLILGTIVAVLDATIVSVAIDSIQRDLGSPLSTMQWVSTGYLLSFALVVPLSGWATERFGAKQVWMTSVACFVGSSALCGLAWSAGSLIAFRILQGLGGGFIQPIGQSMIAQAAGPRRLGRVMSMLVIPLTFAPLLGPVLGGVVLSQLSWPWIFYINVPVGIVTLILAAKVLPATEPKGGHTLDTLGLLLACPSVAALMYGFSEAAGDASPTSPEVTVPVLLGAALLVGYVVHARRYRGNPLLDLRLFGNRGFSVSVSTSFLLGAALFSSMFMLPLYYQQVRGQDALHAGLLLIPQDLGVAVSMMFAGKLSDRLGGPRPIVLAGIVLALAGTLPYTQVGDHPSEVLLTLGLFVRGVGIGATMTPAMAQVFRSVQPQEIPRAAGLSNVLHRVGGSIGTAALAVVLQHQLTAHSAAPAFGDAFWWAFGISALTVVPAVLLPGRQRR